MVRLRGSYGAIWKKKIDSKNNEAKIITEEPPTTQLDLRSRLQNLAFIFSLPHLIMLSNLQKLIGIRTGRRPSIQPNDYMDNLLQNAKNTMKERGLNNVNLPDQGK